MRALGVGGFIVCASAVVCNLTLLPALLYVLGRCCRPMAKHRGGASCVASSLVSSFSSFCGSADGVGGVEGGVEGGVGDRGNTLYDDDDGDDDDDE